MSPAGEQLLSGCFGAGIGKGAGAALRQGVGPPDRNPSLRTLLDGARSGRLDFSPEMCYTSGEEKSEDAVGATGFDGALEGLELREEVVGHLFKLPAKPKCQS